MSETLHLPETEDSDTEDVQLGGETYQVPKDTARAFREQFETLAAQYQAGLEDLQRRQLQSIGTPQPYYPPQPQPMGPEPFTVPDPDILFQNKGQWSEQFGQSLEQQLGRNRLETTQLVQGAVNAFQQELNRRDAMAQARATHDAAMSEMLERRGLTENTDFVQTIYNQQFDKLKNLPLELALDKIGALAQERIEQVRSGETWTIRPVQGGGQAPRPPAMLRSARRATRAPAPAAAPADQGLISPSGGLGAMGTIIRKRQAAVMGGSA